MKKAFLCVERENCLRKRGAAQGGAAQGGAGRRGKAASRIVYFDERTFPWANLKAA